MSFAEKIFACVLHKSNLTIALAPAHPTLRASLCTESSCRNKVFGSGPPPPTPSQMSIWHRTHLNVDCSSILNKTRLYLTIATPPHVPVFALAFGLSPLTLGAPPFTECLFAQTHAIVLLASGVELGTLSLADFSAVVVVVDVDVGGGGGVGVVSGFDFASYYILGAERRCSGGSFDANNIKNL